jgi:hypothetical protein
MSTMAVPQLSLEVVDSELLDSPSMGEQRQGLKRAASDASSSSSEIMVNSAQPMLPVTKSQQMETKPTVNGNAPRSVQLCRVVDGGMLIVKLKPEQLASLMTRSTQTSIDQSIVDGDDSNTDGRNSRGTYSREYTLRHPEIKWTHRGQGRYLPAEEVRKEPAPVSERRSRYVSFNLDFTGFVSIHSRRPHRFNGLSRYLWVA